MRVPMFLVVEVSLRVWGLYADRVMLPSLWALVGHGVIGVRQIEGATDWGINKRILVIPALRTRTLL